MKKKENTIVLIIAATAFNIFLTALIFMAMFSLFFVFIKPLISDNFIVFVLPAVFIASVFLSFGIYRILLRHIMKNVNMDKYSNTEFSFKLPKRKKDVDEEGASTFDAPKVEDAPKMEDAPKP
ncbi:MAG: hypothetical protein LBU19_03605 [Treponema sp.]|jgi:hypothetical protein|nr:hypothetical protein [Treponema sp.]